MGSSTVSNRSNGHLGVTEPISLSGPTESDVIKTQELEKYLVNAGLYESQEEAVSREEVLGRLDHIVKMWVKKISRAKGFNEQVVHEANAKIFTFGSYRLGVHPQTEFYLPSGDAVPFLPYLEYMVVWQSPCFTFIRILDRLVIRSSLPF